MAVRWTHITIEVTDVDRSIAFYERYCGLVVVRDRRPTGGNTVWLGPPGSGEVPTFVLVLSRSAIVTKLTDHLGFQCDTRAEIDGVADEARRLGVLVSPPKDDGPVLGYWMIFRDPDGHFVELTCGQPLAGLP